MINFIASNNTSNNSSYLLIATIILSLSLFIPPIILLILSVLVLFVNNENYQKDIYLFTLTISISITLALINSTKLVESDLAEYYYRYSLVPNYSLIEYLLLGFGGESREPIFKFITFIGYYISNGQFNIFIFLFTLILYIILFKALKNFLEYVNFPKQNYIFIIVLLGFSALYFSFTAHLLRQILAVAIIIYALVEKQSGRTWIYLFIIASFVHLSVLIFLPLFILNIFKEKISLKSTLALLSILVLFFLSYKLVSTFILMNTSSGSLNYVANRFSDQSTLMELGSVANALLMITFVSTLLFFVLFTPLKNYGLISHSILLIGLIILLTSQLSVIQYRVFIMSYSFVPFAIYSIFSFTQNRFIYLLYTILSLFIIGYFFKSITTSAWSYDAIHTVLFSVPFIKLTGAI